MHCQILLKFGMWVHYKPRGLVIEAENDWWDWGLQVEIHR